MPGYGRIIVFLLPAAVTLIGFGHYRLAAIRKGTDDKQNKWSPRLALGFGYSCLTALVLVLIFILYGLYRLGQLDSAIVTVRELVAAESRFARSNPKQGYTCNLAELPTDGWILEQPKVLTKTGSAMAICSRSEGVRELTGNQIQLTRLSPVLYTIAIHRAAITCAPTSRGLYVSPNRGVTTSNLDIRIYFAR